MNDRYEFENRYNEIYLPELNLKQNTSHRETTFLDFRAKLKRLYLIKVTPTISKL